MAVEAMRKGAYDFIEKPFDDEQLLGQVLDALDEFAEAPEPVTLPILSARQRAVLDRVLAGKPNRQIAGELAISLKTVEFHRARIMQKFGVRTAAELFRRCLGSPP
jgi:FixJ family two-component response regulator